MERELGTEMVRAFGKRLRRVYEADDQRLPSQMAQCLERLKQAEREKRAEQQDCTYDGLARFAPAR